MARPVEPAVWVHPNLALTGAAMISALRDPSFSFVDALSVAAWGRPYRRAS